MPNAQILSRGMGWPIGEVVPLAAFPHGHEGHLAIGAIRLVEADITHGHALLASAQTAPGPAEQEVTRLRGEIAALHGQLADAHARRASVEETLHRQREELDRLQRTNETLQLALAGKQARDEQAQRNASRTNPTGKARSPIIPPLSEPVSDPVTAVAPDTNG